jgi:RNA polymerase sigma-70 factor, ECF subfamily
MDQDLVVRVQRGDRRAFEALATADYPRLFQVAHEILSDRSLAEDATQQALLDIWRDIRRLRDPSKYEGWAYRLLVRVCYAEAKRQPKWQPSDELTSAEEPGMADAYGVVADRDQLERGFRHLSMDHRVVLVLHFLMDLTPEEVAEAVGISRWTVYSRLGAATKAMRAALEADARAIVPTTHRQEALR